MARPGDKRIADWLTKTAVIFVVIFLSSCGKQNQSQSKNNSFTEHIVSIRYRDAANPQAPEKDTFVAGESPAIRIQGCGGHTILFLLVDSSTSKVIRGQEEYVGQGKNLHWPFPDLANGSYYVVLKVPGITKREVCEFTVNR